MRSLINDALIFPNFLIMLSRKFPFSFPYHGHDAALLVNSLAAKNTTVRDEILDRGEWMKWERFMIIVIHAEFSSWGCCVRAQKSTAWGRKRKSRKINFLLTQCRFIASNLLLIRLKTSTYRRTFGTSITASSSRSSSARQLVSWWFWGWSWWQRRENATFDVCFIIQAMATSHQTTTLDGFSWSSMRSSVRCSF